jgi:hypothetical protein
MACVLLFGLVSMAYADSTGTPGQPGQSCEAPGSASPGGGNSSKSSGSPFAGASSADNYANGVGTGGPNGNITNSKAVSQYDVACFQATQHQ